MSNMSYCRFRNTLLALQDCRNAIDEEIEHTESVAEDNLSHEEFGAMKDLLELAEEMVQDCKDSGFILEEES